VAQALARLLDALAPVDAVQRQRVLAAAADLLDATLPAADPLAPRGADPRNAPRSEAVRSVVNHLRATAR
jgi:hypothetical protein